MMDRHPAEDGALTDRLRIHALYEEGAFRSTTGQLLTEAANEIERLQRIEDAATSLRAIASGATVGDAATYVAACRTLWATLGPDA